MLLISEKFYKKHRSFFNRFSFNDISKSVLFIAFCIACIGLVVLSSIPGSERTAGIVQKQVIHFIIGAIVMFGISFVDIDLLLRSSYIVYGISIILLVAVSIVGHQVMGASRWIAIGPITIQPSEIAKVGIVMALARYFNSVDIQFTRSPSGIIIPGILFILPFLIVCTQPDLATAILILCIFVGILFVAGIRMYKFVFAGIMILCMAPIIWHNLHDYQKLRITNFMNKNHDPLGSGYNGIQSKIAIGSGGFFGKGFKNGTQSRLRFLPESQTDFAFTVIAEEFGFVGCMAIMLLFSVIIYHALIFARDARKYSHKILSVGAALFFFVHVATNIGMATGMLPVIGIPMPMISYGGTSVVTSAIFIGFILSVGINAKKPESMLNLIK